MTKRLGNTTETFTVTRNNDLAEFFFHPFGNGVDVVTDQADRALGENRNPLGQREQFRGLVDQFFQFLVATVNRITSYNVCYTKLLRQVGFNVGQDRFLVEVEANHLRDVGIDRLVVGDPGTRSVGKGQPTGTVGTHQAGNTKH